MQFELTPCNMPDFAHGRDKRIYQFEVSWQSQNKIYQVERQFH